MGEIGSAFAEAARLIAAADGKLYGIVLLSLEVSLTAVSIATVVGLPIGAALAIRRFPGRQIVLVMNEPKIAALGLTTGQISQALRDIEFWREVGSVQEGDMVRTVVIRQRADSLMDLRKVILLSNAGRIVSRWPRSVGPSYQGVFADSSLAMVDAYI